MATNLEQGSPVGASIEERPAAPESQSVPSGTLLHLLLFLNRLALGWYVVSAGWEKLHGELTVGLGTYFLSDSFQNRSPILPDLMAIPFGYAWPWLETGFGTLLILGLFGRIPAGVVAGLLGCISIALFFTGEWLPRHHSMVFFPLALMLCLMGPGRYSLDTLVRGRRG